MQFEAQDAAYRQTFPTGRFMVVLAAGVPVGRLSLTRLEGEVRIVDIALVAASRGRGIGTRLLSWIVADADADDLPVTLHVDPSSRAIGLYSRLGFETVEQRGINVFMRRMPQGQLKTAS
jgi:ribosomal protein S18 acetylase RimI-like enzyme